MEIHSLLLRWYRARRRPRRAVLLLGVGMLSLDMVLQGCFCVLHSLLVCFCDMRHLRSGFHAVQSLPVYDVCSLVWGLVNECCLVYCEGEPRGFFFFVLFAGGCSSA